jgi:hypothetical protein
MAHSSTRAAPICQHAGRKRERAIAAAISARVEAERPESTGTQRARPPESSERRRTPRNGERAFRHHEAGRDAAEGPRRLPDPRPRLASCHRAPRRTTRHLRLVSGCGLRPWAAQCDRRCLTVRPRRSTRSKIRQSRRAVRSRSRSDSTRQDDRSSSATEHAPMRSQPVIRVAGVLVLCRALTERYRAWRDGGLMLPCLIAGVTKPGPRRSSGSARVRCRTVRSTT